VTRLLLDQNLASRLAVSLRDAFDVEHVRNVGLAEASDAEVWDFARSEGFTIVTKDADFQDMALLRGVPPKVVWLRLGNCTTREVELAIRRHANTLCEFGADPTTAILTIERAPNLS
jgi:predicted nuclease of predicted toxin-antitoxin system